MNKLFFYLLITCFITSPSFSQLEPSAANWKTWFISSGKEYRLPSPSSYKDEIGQVLSIQQRLDSAGRQQILYWNAGSPGYRWYNMMANLYTKDTSANGTLIFANMLLNTAIYDATIAAWNIKYTYKRPRPFEADSRIKVYAIKPESPSYPCEHSVAAGVATAIVSHFYPAWADSVNRMAQEAMASRIAAGVAFPSDTRAGFELGKQIAEVEIASTKGFLVTTSWDQKVPAGPGRWKGKKPMFPLAGHNKTVVLDSANQFRPGPPPDFTKDMAELKAYKQNFRSMANAFFWAGQDFWADVLDKKIFEYNLHLNPPRAARLYAVAAVALYDGFVACWDAKYTYWGIRPNQYDTTFQPALLVTPPFPGYPSGHAAVSGTMCELYSYFFPEEKEYFQKKAKDGAESRFQAGIHFRTDNEVGLELGRRVAVPILQKVKTDGADNALLLANQKSSSNKPVTQKDPKP